MESKKYTPCGGCGATEPDQRCIGCMHPFTEIKPDDLPVTPEWELINRIVSQWGNAVEMPNMEQWLKDYADKSQPGPVWVKASERLPEKDGVYKVRRMYSEGDNTIGFSNGKFDSGVGYTVYEWCDETSILAPDPSLLSISKAFKWASSYKTDKNEYLMLADGWCLICDGGVTEELAPEKVAKLYYSHNQNESPATFNPELLKVISEAEQSKEEDLKAVKEAIAGDSEALDGWIDVNDKLPVDSENNSVYCIVYDSYWGVVVRPYNQAHECWDGEDGDDYYTDAKGGKITHWKPLPDSPFKQQKEK